MEWNEEQKRNILMFYDSIEDYEKKAALDEAQKYLDDTDYVVVKAYEYKITGTELDQDYSDVFAKREEARETIRRLKNAENA